MANCPKLLCARRVNGLGIDKPHAAAFSTTLLYAVHKVKFHPARLRLNDDEDILCRHKAGIVQRQAVIDWYRIRGNRVGHMRPVRSRTKL